MLKPTIIVLFLITLSHVYGQECSNGECSNSENDPDEFEYINSNYEGIRQYVIGYGEKLEAANEELSDLDIILAERKEKNRNHVSLCLADPDFAYRDIKSYTSWDWTMIVRYVTFHTNIKRIPSTKFDMERVKAPFLKIANERRVDEVSIEFWTFSRRLQCLQILRPDVDDEFVDKISDLFETYLYLSKWIKSSNEKAISRHNRGEAMKIVLLIVFFCLSKWYAPVRELVEQFNQYMEEISQMFRDIFHPFLIQLFDIAITLAVSFIMIERLYPGNTRVLLQEFYKIVNDFPYIL